MYNFIYLWNVFEWSSIFVQERQIEGGRVGEWEGGREREGGRGWYSVDMSNDVCVV